LEENESMEELVTFQRTDRYRIASRESRDTFTYYGDFKDALKTDSQML